MLFAINSSHLPAQSCALCPKSTLHLHLNGPLDGPFCKRCYPLRLQVAIVDVVVVVVVAVAVVVVVYDASGSPFSCSPIGILFSQIVYERCRSEKLDQKQLDPSIGSNRRRRSLQTARWELRRKKSNHSARNRCSKLNADELAKLVGFIMGAVFSASIVLLKAQSSKLFGWRFFFCCSSLVCLRALSRLQVRSSKAMNERKEARKQLTERPT